MLAIDMPVAEVFLSNIFLAIFAFLITNVETIAADILSQSQVPVFIFLLVKIATL